GMEREDGGADEARAAVAAREEGAREHHGHAMPEHRVEMVAPRRESEEEPVGEEVDEEERTVVAAGRVIGRRRGGPEIAAKRLADRPAEHPAVHDERLIVPDERKRHRREE